MDKNYNKMFCNYISRLNETDKVALKKEYGNSIHKKIGSKSWVTFYKLPLPNNISKIDENIYFFVSSMICKFKVNPNLENKISVEEIIKNKYKSMTDSQKSKIDLLFRLKIDEYGKFFTVLKNILGNDIKSNLNVEKLLMDLQMWNYGNTKRIWATNILKNNKFDNEKGDK